MDDLIAHIKSLAPVAEAIVYINEHAKEIEEIGPKLEQLRTDLEQGEARLKEIADQAKQHSDMSEQAKASVIEARSRLDSMVAGARADADRLVKKSQADAMNAAKATTESFKGLHAGLQSKIETAKQTLQNLTEEISAKTKDHNAVLASMASLKSRLGAA